ncbi:MAG: PIN domain-containing protein [Verrucomicrobiota bacterium]
MNVVVDTSVWSLALRRSTLVSSGHVEVLKDVISDGRAILLGVVRQEILSGIRHYEQLHHLRKHLRAFPDPAFEAEDYETAAAHANTCRTKGIQGSLIDFLICAYAGRRSYQILSTDSDFLHYSRHIPVSLMTP